MRVRNIHERQVPASPEQIAGILDQIWSGTERDVFPRDRLVTWRAHHDGKPDDWDAPNTKFGHATLRFRLRHWDGRRFEADVLSRDFRGWHGFELSPAAQGTVVRHVLAGDLYRGMRWRWPIAIRPLHDWAVEALLDRLEHAVSEGQPPVTTERPMTGRAHVAYVAMDWLSGGALSGVPQRLPFNWGATATEMRAPLPCDALLVPPDQRLFRAVTVNAPASTVFRWLCQLRVAPYSYDWIDNFGRRSPRELTPGLDALDVGQRFMRIFRLVAFEQNRHITLELVDPSARSVFGDLFVTYALQEDAGTTRLLGKLVTRYPRTMRGAFMRRFLPWGDWFMMRKQLLTLRALSEAM